MCIIFTPLIILCQPKIVLTCSVPISFLKMLSISLKDYFSFIIIHDDNTFLYRILLIDIGTKTLYI